MAAGDREALFRNTAAKMGLTEAIAEKDFWVCFLLDYLFHRCPWRKSFAFKGGTSLSKAYGLIQRFSEDIDLIVAWQVLGYSKDEPWIKRTVTQQDLFNKQANEKTRAFLRDAFLPSLVKELSIELEQAAQCYLLDSDPQTVCFRYPNSFSDHAILQEIRLEMGVLAAWGPSAK